MNSGILTAKVMTVKIKQVAYKETAECMQGQPVCHLTKRAMLSLLTFLEAMSVLLFIFVSFLISIVSCSLMHICTDDYIAILLLHDTGYCFVLFTDMSKFS